MVPLTVFTTYGIVTETTGGRLPLAYVVTLITMVFTALSYARMSAAIPVAGSASPTQRTFGARSASWPDGRCCWTIVPAMLNYLVIGLYLNAALPALPRGSSSWSPSGSSRCSTSSASCPVAQAQLFLIIAIQAIFIVVFRPRDAPRPPAAEGRPVGALHRRRRRPAAPARPGWRGPSCTCRSWASGLHAVRGERPAHGPAAIMISRTVVSGSSSSCCPRYRLVFRPTGSPRWTPVRPT